jgi:phage shock protein C
MEKRLYRNEHDRTIAGVASGLSDYLQIDKKIIILLFCLSIPFLAGTGLLVYVILWIVLPVKNDPQANFRKFNDYFQKNPNDPFFNSPSGFNDPTDAEQTKWNTPNAGPDFGMKDQPAFGQQKQSDTSRTIVGLLLLLLGLFLFLRFTLDVLPEWFSIWKIWQLWPVVIIIIGVNLIFKNKRKSEWEKFKKSTEDAQRTDKQPVEDTVIVEDHNDSPNP